MKTVFFLLSCILSCLEGNEIITLKDLKSYFENNQIIKYQYEKGGICTFAIRDDFKIQSFDDNDSTYKSFKSEISKRSIVISFDGMSYEESKKMFMNDIKEGRYYIEYEIKYNNFTILSYKSIPKNEKKLKSFYEENYSVLKKYTRIHLVIGYGIDIMIAPVSSLDEVKYMIDYCKNTWKN